MKNVGTLDRTLRILIGLVALYLALKVSAWFWIIVVVALVTGILGICPLYKLFGICTGCPTKREEEIKKEWKEEIEMRKVSVKKPATRKSSGRKTTKSKSKKKTTKSKKSSTRKKSTKKKKSTSRKKKK